MITKLVTGIGILAAIFYAAGASAADMATKAAPRSATIFDWTGCYVGAHFGGTWGNKQATDSSGDSFAGLSSVTADTGGFLPGGQLGCDYQFSGNWVVGVRGSLSAFTLKGQTTLPEGADTGDFTAKADWLASATARVGYAWKPWLFYVTGGAAWVHDQYNVGGSVPVPFDFAATNDTRAGWTLGFGFEYVFWGSWSADLQYAHYDFGTKSLAFVDSLGGVSTVANTKQWIDAITLGLNYHFNGESWQPSRAVNKEPGQETVAINGGITVTRPYSLYGDFAMLWGPGGLDNSGFRVRLATVDGRYSYLQDNNFGPRLYGNGEEGSGMVGYEFVQGKTSILLATGLDYVTGSSNPPIATGNTSNPVPGTTFGSKSLVELYSTPTDKTMVEAEGSYSTAFREYYEQFQVGYAALGPEIYIGPEAIFLGDENYDEYRFGAFVSGIKIGKVELGFSGGYLRDRAQGSGYYVGSDFYVRY